MQENNQTKKCIKCEVKKPVTLFAQCKAAADGLQRYCKACQKTITMFRS